MIREYQFEAVRAEKLRFGLFYGLIAGLVYSFIAWGYDAILLARSNAMLPWLQWIIGGIPCLLLGALAGWLTYRINNFLASFVIWLLTGAAFAWLAGHVPFDLASAAIGIVDPSARQLIDYPVVLGAQLRMVIIFVAVIVLSVIAGLLEIGLVEGSTEFPAPIGRFLPMVLWIALFFLAGLAAENNITQDLRQPVQNTNSLIQFAIDHRGQTVDPKLAAEMHLGAVRDLAGLMDRPRRLLLTRYDELMFDTTVVIDFGGQWATCSVFNAQPSYCKPVSRSELIQMVR